MPAMHDYGKMLMFALCLLTTAVLAGLDVLAAEDVRLTLGMIFAYLAGNGVNAVKKQPGSPVLVPRLTVHDGAASDAEQEPYTYPETP